MILRRFSLDEWNKMNPEKAHEICFKEQRPREMNTFDFALLVEDRGTPQCYSTCIELDKESVYMQHGGAFPSVEKNIGTVRSYHLMINYLKEHYKRASTRIENKNIPMLKLAFSAGFLINGIDLFGNEIFLHLKNDFGVS